MRRDGLRRVDPARRCCGVHAAEALEARIVLSAPVSSVPVDSPVDGQPQPVQLAPPDAAPAEMVAVAAVAVPIDGALLDRIDQLAPTYYNPAWNLSLEQFKAWVATIARAEGGLGEYAAHSQGNPTFSGDVFAHRARSTFRFSTGIGPFQLDRGGVDGWDTWSTIRKLDPAESVRSTMHQHASRFGAGATLATFAANSAWFAVNPTHGGNVAAHWSNVTGTDWAAQSAERAALDWASIKAALSTNAGNLLRYDSNVRDLGLRPWSIDAADGLVADSGAAVTLVGDSPTWLITARSWEGAALFDYYYTNSGGFEFWVLSNPTEANPFRYAFFRQYTRQVFPEGRSGNLAGVTLAFAALSPEGTPPTASFVSAPTITTAGGTTQTMTVRFADNLAIDASTLGAWDVLVTGPNGFSQSATFVSVSPAGSGSPRTATYRIAAPGGAWDGSDNGTYTISLQPNQVKDVSGNAAAAGALGTFAVALPTVRVSQVFVSGSSWSSEFRGYMQRNLPGSGEAGFAVPAGAHELDPLPWVNLDRVSVTFSAGVRVDANDLRVFGANVPEYELDPAGFFYDASTLTATWLLVAGRRFGNDRIMLGLSAGPDGVSDTFGAPLDGDWANPGSAAASSGFPSGDGSAGGDFRFALSVLPGDVTRDGAVLADDYSSVRKRFFTTATSPGTGDSTYSAFYDADGDGQILAADCSEVRRRFFSQLSAPTAIAVPTSSVSRLLGRTAPPRRVLLG